MSFSVIVIITPSVEIIMGGKKKDERKISQKNLRGLCVLCRSLREDAVAKRNK